MSPSLTSNTLLRLITCWNCILPLSSYSPHLLLPFPSSPLLIHSLHQVTIWFAYLAVLLPLFLPSCPVSPLLSYLLLSLLPYRPLSLLSLSPPSMLLSPRQDIQALKTSWERPIPLTHGTTPNLYTRRGRGQFLLRSYLWNGLFAQFSRPVSKLSPTRGLCMVLWTLLASHWRLTSTCRSTS